MSPASQGSLEVERYIGSCLISSGGHQQYKSKKTPPPPHAGPRMLACPHGYALMMCECTARYGSAGHAGASWAGMPLISMAAHSRRARKPTPAGEARTPLSRLAIHTQGAPLILAGHFNAARKNSNNTGVQRGRQYGKPELPGRRCDAPRDARSGGSSSNTPNSDCLSVASDESSGHSENSLPRIIKPRKRRKKDRKPTAASPTSAEADAAAGLPGIVTLKPYVPLCHELYDGHRGGRRRDDGEADERTLPSSEDDGHDATLKGPDVPDDDAPLNTLFPYPCPPNTCQCRYCDPAGQIWDVDQHCYSPFLTPPALDLSYTESPLVHIPLFLTPPPESKTFDFFNKDFKNSSSTVTDAEHKEVVRRSWSEPGTLYSDNDDARSPTTDFGVIGGGRASDSGGRRARADAPRLLSTSSESSTHSSISPSLVVSTEIVTSLNGHRDIEIKFFSSSPSDVNGGCDSSAESVWSSVDGDVWTDGNVWGKGSEDADGGAWGPVRQPAVVDDASTKLPIEEVNQLCLQNVEE